MRKVIFFIVFITIGHADMGSPSHYCSKPYKPFQFSSQYEIDSFRDDVERYKRCIMDFIDEQDNAITSHEGAKSDAIDEWNSFVNYELN